MKYYTLMVDDYGNLQEIEENEYYEKLENKIDDLIHIIDRLEDLIYKRFDGFPSIK